MSPDSTQNALERVLTAVGKRLDRQSVVDASLKRSMMDQKRGRFVRTMAAITLEQLKDVIVHLSDKEFEELVEAREQAWDRQIETDAEAGKLDQLAEEALRDFREGKCIRLP